jgi:hypothetical protein
MFSGVLDEPDSESAICSSLVNRGVPSHLPSLPTQRDDPNKVLAGSNPALAFSDTSNRTESPGEVGSSNPDLGMLRENDTNRGNLKDSHSDSRVVLQKNTFTLLAWAGSIRSPKPRPPMTWTSPQIRPTVILRLNTGLRLTQARHIQMTKKKGKFQPSGRAHTTLTSFRPASFAQVSTQYPSLEQLLVSCAGSTSRV